MTDLRQAATLALEALNSDDPSIQLRAAITLRTALEQPEQEPKHVVKSNGRYSPLLTHMMNKRDSTPPAQPEQEPVAWFSKSGTLYRTRFHAAANGEQLLTPLYTSPAERPWVGLTDEDKKKIATAAGCTDDDDGHIVTEIFRLAEAELKERNGY